ncbi:MAG TPA: ABC transporter ATP-binding protein [Desulfobulbaceae bacterium]|nr:ABC transporter ATP-binding protein [Desulfobulbaceae bacterium]
MHARPAGPREKECSVEGFCKRFGAYHALSDVSFTLFTGEIAGLIGPNGAGKSTLLECMTGLLPVDAGTIRRQGKKLTLAERHRFLWYQPDDALPFARQRVRAIVSFFRRMHGRERRDFEELVTGLELAQVLAKPLHTLSKGYRRRVLLALALLSRQPLLLLDEPFDGFDLRQSLSVMDLLRRWKKDRTMLLSIHQLSEAEKICDRFLLLDQGRMPAVGTLEELAGQAGLASEATLEEVFLAFT